jgi:Uri superfamily endonuclease
VKSECGTYALILRCDSQVEIRAGRLGLLDVEAGYYVYVGSAFGPGGVRARVLRHARRKTARHWHIDYLRDVAEPVAVWCGYSVRDLEHRWAKILCSLPDAISVRGFGCSDCTCESHLFRFGHAPGLECLACSCGGLTEAFLFGKDDHCATMVAIRTMAATGKMTKLTAKAPQ